ncbi:MAG: LLM class flavin-dependent oxidoreductase [Gammaproteobacteria bacterium]|jgi:alkanesulfonate monooxygenase SsuD/methylene tetrahydromethanopterin reductase-like flavin-dependent oxidoreductase (luciferase family)|nr:LLM class flavin-dependent oxidoreductase [Gammaproteobacteria bacterium]
MRIDLILESNNSPERIAELGQLAEANGIGAIWISGMLDGRDPFAVFTKLALTTSRIRMGPIAVSPFELHPLMMAKSLLTLNEYAQGRAQMVVGGGGGTATAMNLPLERRVGRVRETLDILRLAARGEPLDYEGELYQIRNYNPFWANSHPPAVYVGANREQMIKMGARHAERMMLSDKMVVQVAETKALISATRQRAGLPPEPYGMTNFWAWHVKRDRAAAVREARIWLALRGVLLRKNHEYFMSPEDCDLVDEKRGVFFQALRKRSPEIPGVPDRIIDQLIDNLTSTASVDEIDSELERLRAFAAAGLTEIALRIYEEPEETIRLLGERVVPALADA